VDRRFFFRKDERLSGEKSVQLLFTESAGSIFIYPIKLSWRFREVPIDPPVRVLLSVAKKRFRKATSRNYIKRLMRETYRRNSHVLTDKAMQHHQKIDIALAYVGEKPISITEMDRIFLSIAHRFAAQLDHLSSTNQDL
jgi:ribonuclease P protein component